MAETGITKKIVQANNSTPGVVPKSKHQIFCGRLIKLLTSCVPRRSRASSSNINASSSPLRIENAEKFDTSQTGKFDQRSKSKQNRDAGDGEVKTELSRDNEITRKNDSPVKALEQRQATTLNAKDNPLERTNALISDDNQIKEKGNGKQKPVAGDGEVKTGPSGDSVLTSENDASVTTVAQRRTKELNASATRPKKKNAEIFDKNKITGTENKATGAENEATGAENEATGAENETAPTQRRLKKLISTLFKQYEEKSDPVSGKRDDFILSCELDDFILYHTVRSLNSSEELPSELGNVLSDEDQSEEVQLNALKTWIGNNKDDLLKNSTFTVRAEIVNDIYDTIKKSRDEVYKEIDQLTKAEAGQNKFHEDAIKLMDDFSRDHNSEVGSSSLFLVAALSGFNERKISEIENKIKQLPSVQKIKDMIGYIEENEIINLPEVLEPLQQELKKLDDLVANPRERSERTTSNTPSLSDWVRIG